MSKYLFTGEIRQKQIGDRGHVWDDSIQKVSYVSIVSMLSLIW